MSFLRLIVALFTRAWIEIDVISVPSDCGAVALFTRAWIEIDCLLRCHVLAEQSPSLRGRGLKSTRLRCVGEREVALFTRAWIEIHI